MLQNLLIKYSYNFFDYYITEVTFYWNMHDVNVIYDQLKNELVQFFPKLIFS